MTIPGFQEIFHPLLELASDGEIHTLQEAYERLADHFELTDEERKQLLPSGRQATFANRTGWARTYLEKAGLLSKPGRGQFQITAEGSQVLADPPNPFDIGFLDSISAEFTAFRTPKVDDGASAVRAEVATEPRADENPDEAIESAYLALRLALATELLGIVKSQSPAFFERLVVDLLVNMGYGGSRREAGMALGRSGDGGVDGMIKEDRLGLDVIYIQAKRWENTVGRPDVQKFAGALQGRRARKGIFITTSDYSSEAREYVGVIETKIILINGAELADLMIDHDVGVATAASYLVKKVDSDYFDDGD
jgi:restriction system protein